MKIKSMPFSKGQSAIEITIITSMMLLIFSVMLVILLNKAGQAQMDQDRQSLEQANKAIADELLMAAFSEEGYVRLFEIPELINGINFTISLLSKATAQNYTEIALKSINHTFSFEGVEIVPVFVNGTLVKGQNRIVKKQGWEIGRAHV